MLGHVSNDMKRSRTMIDRTSDTALRLADARRNRRKALATLAAAAVATSVVMPQATGAKKKSRKSKKQVALKRCRVQAGPCQAALAIFCENASGADLEVCLGRLETCCSALTTCDAGTAMECLVDEFIFV
jgi:hypothetical protein